MIFDEDSETGMAGDESSSFDRHEEVIDFELEDAKTRSKELARKNVLLDVDIHEIDYNEKKQALEKRQQRAWWLSWMGDW